MRNLFFAVWFIFLLNCTNVGNNEDIAHKSRLNKLSNSSYKNLKDTVIIGQAHRGKGGAIVNSISNGYVFYIDGVYWDDNTYGKTVKVSGQLLVVKHEEYPYKDSIKAHDNSENFTDDIDSTEEELVVSSEEIVFSDEIIPQKMYGQEFRILNPKWELYDTIQK
jgi:hypothetical protein